MAVIARGHDGDDLAVAHHGLVVEQHRLGIGQLELHQRRSSPSSRLAQHRVAADEITLLV
jgi:hypothetical protein